MPKGRNKFSPAEAASIRQLLNKRQKAESSDQKLIRDQLRRFGFYITDYDSSKSGFGPEDFDHLIVSNQITINNVDADESEYTNPPIPKGGTPQREHNDETYIIGLCDEVLGRQGKRQHRFPFLVGDSGSKLPVDVYYNDLNLVIEYRERQHSEPVKLFDKRQTVSDVDRGTQRKIYDQRRRDVLPQHGITLVEISYDMFEYDSKKRLVRKRSNDIDVVQGCLKNWLS